MSEDGISYTQKLFTGRVKTDVYNFVGQQGRIFYNEDTGELRLSDGLTPYGLPIFGTGGGTSLLLYTESGSPVDRPSSGHNVSIAMGDGSFSRLYGSIVHASGKFTDRGDSQIGNYVSRAITTNSDLTELFLDGIGARLLIQPNMSMAFTVTCIARRTDSYSNEGAVYEIRGGIDRSSTLVSTRLIGTPSKTVVSEDNPLWDISVSADINHGALKIRVKGETDKTIRWVAQIQTVEVTFQP
jgi:hypothetical protein